MNQDLWAEIAKLVAEYDAQRPIVIKEYRLYHNEDGSIIGLWESDHPAGNNYIVLDDPGIYFHTNTHLLKVIKNKLIILDPKEPSRVRLKKSNFGFLTVKGHAALTVESKENYELIEYYAQTNY